ncbi:hypothetical protein CFIMG_002670RAa2 [Ceratocystis fimbriata CBS 114723]|uniref:Uncharacterized protein n=1 Tax=Ceratocystis fimbriata CBS 114723 TaxID=1035309 RepID=A0A2C5X0C6_9PEZI|nr:hypothetical protein CFIMG_002670RAa2 [Ceratocystis fimbriata CBS 114723]
MPGYKKTQRGRPFLQSNYGGGSSRTAGECAERTRSNAWANPEREDSLQLARSKRREELQAEMYSRIEPQAMEVGYFHLSEDEYRPLNLSGNCIDWFKEVSDQHHVQLNQHETDPSIIVVRSNSPINIKKALAAMSILYSKQQYLESSENTTLVWRIPNTGIPASKRITFIASQNVQESRAKLTGEGGDIVPGTASKGEVSSFAKKMAPILQAEILKVAYMPHVVSLTMKIGLLKYSSIPAGSSLTLQQFDRLLTTRGSRLKSALDPRYVGFEHHNVLLES